MVFTGSLAIYNTIDSGTNIREDLLPFITMITPTETPFFSMWPKRAAKSTIHEWLTDSLASFGDPDVGDADVMAINEGSDATFDPLTPRKRLCNLTHILRKTYDVTDTQRNVDTAGVDDEYYYQMRKAGKELARNIEFALIHSVRQFQVGQGNAVGTQPRKMDGFIAYALSTDPTCATTQDLVGDELPTHFTADGFSPESCLNACNLAQLLEEMWRKGAQTDKLAMNSKQKRALSNFTLNPNSQIRYTQQVSDKTFVNSIDIVQSDFGTQQTILHRYVPTDAVLAMEAAHLAIAVLRPVLAVDLAKVGSSSKGMMEAELTLEVLAPNGIGILDGLCTGVPGCPPALAA